ncbi:amidase [Roseivivax lentus]|nr:amidase [Roseivivax lentus]
MKRELDEGATNAASLAQDALTRATALNDELAAFIALCPEDAQHAARESDARRVEGRARGPLDGIPFAVKNNMDVAGLVTTCGTAMKLAPAARDATVVARLRAAGAVLIGALNMHEGALGATNDNPVWGRCQNPLRAGYTPGGSSGGSAAAVAAGIVPFALGSDTMGSVRIPAAYCGLWGLKPTAGRLSSAGLAHLAWTLDAIGPMARAPEDLARVMAALDGFDSGDPLSASFPDGQGPQSLAGLTFGIPDAALLDGCEDAVRAGFETFVDGLRERGAEVEVVSIPNWTVATLRRACLLIAEVEGAAIMGDRIDAPGLSDAFRSMLRFGRDAGAIKVTQAYRVILETRRGFEHAIHSLDGFVTPTVPHRAFPHGDPVPANQADFTTLSNAAGAPALCLPLAATDGGLPVSMQIMGPAGTDMRLIRMATSMSDMTQVARWNLQEALDPAFR